jgi:orotate phosphoribosyltransferase
MELKKPLIYVRSSSKEHGRQNAIEGFAAKGTRCVLIEDLISTGKSSIAAAQKLVEGEVKVEKILSIFNYDFKQAQEIFNKEQIPFESLTTFDVLAKVAYDNKTLDETSLNQVLKWRESVVFP